MRIRSLLLVRDNLEGAGQAMYEEAQSSATSDGVVVGVDGSPCSKSALAWAARHR